MHSFTNSQNFERRKNNWELLQKFFKDPEVDYDLKKEDWIKILNDNDSE